MKKLVLVLTITFLLAAVDSVTAEDEIETSILIDEIGAFRTDNESFTQSDGTQYPILYSMEAFHIKGSLSLDGGEGLTDKCLNIYVNPEINDIPISTTISDENGNFDWYMPTEVRIEELEGFHVVRIEFEPENSVAEGCESDAGGGFEGSTRDIGVLVRSNVDIIIKENWQNPSGYAEGEIVEGEVVILRDRFDLTVEGEIVEFHKMFWNDSEWKTASIDRDVTDEDGSANFSFEYTQFNVPQHHGFSADEGKWAVFVHFENTNDLYTLFVERWLNSTPIIMPCTPSLLESACESTSEETVVTTPVNPGNEVPSIGFTHLIAIYFCAAFSYSRRNNTSLQS